MNKNIFIIIFRLILLPFSLLFYVITAVRNIFFNLNIFKVVNFEKPVISVGNISTGGTGKTPFVIYLAKFYLEKGFKTGIVTRGYKGKLKKTFLVSDGKQIFGEPGITGDEAQVIASQLSERNSNFSVCVSKDRMKGISFLTEHSDPDLIILDDAFQNRWIKRDLDLVLIDTENFDNLLNKFLLPSGNLRESRNSLKRADFIISNYKFTSGENSNENVNNILYKYSKPVVNIRYIFNNKFTEQFEKDNLIDKKAIVFCGIGQPASFLRSISNLGIRIKKTMIYKDHHHYKKEDIELLVSIYEKNDIFLTTEKDFVKIKKYKEFSERFPVYSAVIETEIIKHKQLLEEKLISLVNIIN